MASANKTLATTTSPTAFLAKVSDPQRRADANALIPIFERATGERATMWGSAIVGFGTYHYRYESGREGDMCIAGFSPRSSAFAIYALSGAPREAELLGRLGKHERSKGCLYVKRLADIDVAVLEELVRTSSEHTRATHTATPAAKPKAAKPKAAAPKAKSAKAMKKPAKKATKRRS